MTKMTRMTKVENLTAEHLLYRRKSFEGAALEVSQRLPENIYRKLAKTVEAGHYDKSPGSTYDAINRDVARTFPDVKYFSSLENANAIGQTALKNVLLSYSLYDTEVSYCQGMAFIVGILLMNFNFNEEKTFAATVHLMRDPKLRLRDLYLPSMDGLQLRFYHLERLLELWLPDVHQHLQNMGYDLITGITSWLMTAFSADFPLSFANRFIDVMISREDGNLLVKLAYVILHSSRKQILKIKNMEEAHVFFKKIPSQKTDRELRRLLYSALHSRKFIFLNKEVLKSFTKEYQSFRETPDVKRFVPSTELSPFETCQVEAPNFAV